MRIHFHLPYVKHDHYFDACLTLLAAHQHAVALDTERIVKNADSCDSRSFDGLSSSLNLLFCRLSVLPVYPWNNVYYY